MDSWESIDLNINLNNKIEHQEQQEQEEENEIVNILEDTYICNPTISIPIIVYDNIDWLSLHIGFKISNKDNIYSGSVLYNNNKDILNIYTYHTNNIRGAFLNILLYYKTYYNNNIYIYHSGDINTNILNCPEIKRNIDKYKNIDINIIRKHYNKGIKEAEKYYSEYKKNKKKTIKNYHIV